MSPLDIGGSVSTQVRDDPSTAPLESPGYLARQPILDRRGTVFAYELHFHGPVQPPFEPGLTSPFALIDALAVYGVERFTARSRAFLSCSMEMLTDGGLEGLPPARTVLEIPSSSEPIPKLVRACRNLRAAGFQLALVNFDSTRATDDMLPIVDYVKVDARVLESPEWDLVCRKLFGNRAVVIADKVHTHDAYRHARSLGVRYFQGFYFCNPELIPSSRIPVHRAQQVQILRQLFRDPLDLKTLCPLVMADPSLVYRVLRFVNSPLCAIHETVSSIESALMILGDNTFRRIATLAIQCGLSEGQPPELLHMALIRARFCSTAASLCALNPDEQYLLGMLSLLPPMLGIPMQSILPQLPLRHEMLNALSGNPSRERALLSWIECLEENRIAGCEQIAVDYKLDRDKLAELYWKALEDDSHAGLID
jgi:c-di-GMP phosphodiesterase